MLNVVIASRAAGLSLEAGLGEFRSLTPLAGGKNNRVFLLEAKSGRALLKSYFRHPDDPRDRLGTEFAFSRFAWDHGVRALPKPLACDAEAGLGVFEYVDGRLLAPQEVDATAIDQAIAFFHDVNRYRLGSDAAKLPFGSESCFRLRDHLNLMQNRLDRLAVMPVESDIDAAAHCFVKYHLLPAWARIENWARRQAVIERLALDEALPVSERCVSPSDFGYHNAILASDGRLRFVDFEYAGWDDPARTVCDFFCQPAIPAPISEMSRFVEAIAEAMPSPELHLFRASLLLPVYRVKWCCIILNDFLPAGSRRRQFSDSGASREERKARQLDKARDLLTLLTNSAPFSTLRMSA